MINKSFHPFQPGTESLNTLTDSELPIKYSSYSCNLFGLFTKNAYGLKVEPFISVPYLLAVQRIYIKKIKEKPN